MADPTWQFSPPRFRGHRLRHRLSRHQMAALMGVTLARPRGWSRDAVKSVEYGYYVPSLEFVLSAAGSLGISPNDLCRTHLDDDAEFIAGLNWTPPPPTPRSTP